MTKPSVIIVSPALAAANNGNWQTALRWSRLLRSRYRVALSASWEDQAADIMIALHARRSAASISSFSHAHPARPLIVVLTGTDLYRDIVNNPEAQQSLALANRLVVLQEQGLSALPADLRRKTMVIRQSAPALRAANDIAGTGSWCVTMAGHLREEKNPACFIRAAALLALPHLRFLQIGVALDPALEEQANALQRQHQHYRWLGNTSHVKTRHLISRSQLLVLPSRMEGGANVIAEAIRSGVPVLASDIPGNRGMLGNEYFGYFPFDDSAALATLIQRCMQEPVFYGALLRQCRRRAALFSPAREQAALLQLLDNVRHCQQEPS